MDRELHAEDFGFRREPVRGTTYDSGGPMRDVLSGRDYPGGRTRRDPHYARGPYAPSSLEPTDYDYRHDAYEHVRAGDYADAFGRGDYDDTYDGASQQGPHAGRGPSGYRRPADDIREDVCERLTHHGHIDASDIEVRVEGDEVTLEGTVDSRHTKRLAEGVAAAVKGVFDVHNRLRVVR